MKNLGLLGSSVDPSQLSATISGLIISLSAVIILIAGHFGLVLGTDQISQIAVAFGGAIGAIATLYGLIRKVLVKTVAPSV